MEKVKHGAASQQAQMRTYGQFCALARALDIVGDRWTLLIVRDLLSGPLRYGELKSSLGGIATNLLSSRLKSLEDHGVIERQIGDQGIAYALTPWGAELRCAMESLGRWGAPLIARGRGDDWFHPRWLVPALPALLGRAVATPTIEIGLEVEDYFITLIIDETGPKAFPTPGRVPDTVFAADPETIVGLAAGGITLQQALTSGRLTGDPAPVERAFTTAHKNHGAPNAES